MQEKERKILPESVIPALVSAGLGLAAAVIVAAVIGGILCASSDPHGMLIPSAIAVNILSGLTAGIAGRIRGGGVCGLLAGAVLMLFMIIISAVVPGSGASASMPYPVIIRACMLASAAGGAFIGGGRRGAVKRPKIKRI